MVAERCITIPLLKAELASVLVGAGIPAMEADRLAGLQAHSLHRSRAGDRTYWAKGRKRMGLEIRERREIFLEWYSHGTEGRTGRGLLAEYDISKRTLERIIAEGRRLKWAVR